MKHPDQRGPVWAIWGLVGVFGVVEAAAWTMAGAVPRRPGVLVQVGTAWIVMIILASLATRRLKTQAQRIRGYEHSHQETLGEIEQLQTQNAMLEIIARSGTGQYRMRQEHGARPFASNDPDSQRIWWNGIGVHQNLTFPVQPDPVSGMHCWHQRVRLERAGPDDRYGDIEVDTDKAHEAYKEWMQRTRPAPGPDGTRRPLWFDRPLRPVPAAYRMPPAKTST